MDNKLKITRFFLITVLMQFSLAIASSNPNKSSLTSQQQSAVLFKENKGQVCDQHFRPRPDVLFSGVTGNLVYHLKTKGVSYQITKVDEWRSDELYSRSNENSFASTSKKIPARSTTYRIDVNWLNANSNCVIEKGEAEPGVENYYTAANPNGITNVKSFKDLTYKNIYNNIDLKWYQKDGALEYDFILHPGADHKKIQLEILGAEKISINKKGELEIKTPLGTIIEKAPVAYQNNKNISCNWEIKGNKVSFKLANYDSRLPITIDPAVRLWGTYYGGTGIEYGYGCATDAGGNVYTCGFTQTTVSAIIATAGAHQTVSGGGTNDSFLAKFNTNGTRLWATFYGGGGLDVGTACATDALGNVIMAGYTDSNNGIASAGSHQSSLVGDVEAFLVKFNSAGVRQWGTYYADVLNEYGYGCAFDGSGNAYLSGFTTSAGGSLIATPGSHQSTMGGGIQDGFLVKFNSAGVRQWGTYYGGTGNDFGVNCVTDGTGNVFLSGRTASTNSAAISTPGCHQPISGGNFDAYLVKFNSAGVRQWGTHYGGFGIDYGYSCATDASGNVFLSGSTDSNNSTEIATVGSHQSVFGGGFGDAYLVKFNAAGVRQWGTYYGGNNYEEGVTCTTDISGNVYMGGQTSSATSTIMATAGSHQASFGGGAYDAYLVKFNTNGVRQFGTYYGETGSDYGFALSVDQNLNIFLVGYTGTNGGTSIATNGSHQPNMGGGTFDAFLAKFFDCPLLVTDAVNQLNVSCYGLNDGAVTASVTSGGSNFTYSWSPIASTLQTITNLAPGFYTCVITNTCGSSATQTVQITEPTSVSVTAASNNSIICVGSTATLTAIGVGGNGSFTYTWNPGSISNPAVISPTLNTTYTVTAADVNGCAITTTLTQNVSICTAVFEPLNNETSFFTIYPNPSQGEITIELSQYYLSQSNEGKTHLQILNSLGQILFYKTISTQFTKLNLDELAGGIYFLIGQQNDTVIKHKIIITK
jgi:hypothetical protein